MAIVTGDRYLDALFKFVEAESSALIDGTLVLKVNPVGLHYMQSRLEQLRELEALLAGAPVDYLRAYISDLGDHRALEQLRRILRLLPSLKVVSVLPPTARDPTPISLLPFGRLKVLELRGCDLSTSAAGGLLELRHTLEKIICHNSTDALRHVFASRIVDIKESPVWNKLSFVSCACNGVVLMDESLQLLPAVETLDLSRNRFAKVDNLRRCTKLRHLDLGFNHLRTVASLSEVSCPLVKLVLRNNALTTLCGIENLKSVEGLDLSYNIISNFSELELLASLSSLKNLWLEGNPVCCSRWYRAQVFSFFRLSENLKLDERGISTQETWKRQIILASRQKLPSGYGFYSPAKDESEEGSLNTKRRKMSRLAYIEEEEQRSFYGSETVDQESISCDSGYLRRDESAISDGEAEIVGLMNKVELMKKEQSVLWLREFREWMDHNSEDAADVNKFAELSLVKENYRKRWKGHKHLGESSSLVPDLVHDSGDESSTNFLESDLSFTDTSVGFGGHDCFDFGGKSTLESSMTDRKREAKSVLRTARLDSEEQLKAPSHDEMNILPLGDVSTILGSDKMEQKVGMTSLTAIDEIMVSRSSSIHHGSPPHYQEDLLHRRQNLEEEFLQLSAESFSLASSDSDTSCDDDSCKICTSFPGADRPLNSECVDKSMGKDQSVPAFDGSYYDSRNGDPDMRENDRSILYYFDDPSFSNIEILKPDVAKPFHPEITMNGECGGIVDEILSQDADCLEKKRGKRKPRRRIIPLSEENLMVGNAELLSQKLNGVLDLGKGHIDDNPGQPIFHKNSIQKSDDEDTEHAQTLQVRNTPICHVGNLHLQNRSEHPTPEADEFIKNYFYENLADPRVSETCLQYMRCECILRQASSLLEIEVAVLRSSERKLCILLIDATADGNISKVLGLHRLQDIKEVVIGIGLQVLRLQIEGDAAYLFITRSIEKSRALLSLLQVCGSSESTRCSLRSWEQVQVKLFEDHIYGGLKMSIFQYSMLLFCHNNDNGESWLPRSLFVIEEYVFVCIEDLLQFGSIADDAGVSSPYFTLDSCCPINSILEMVIEYKESGRVTMSLSTTSKKIDILPRHEKAKQFEMLPKRGTGDLLEDLTSASHIWRFKWLSEDAAFQFVALVKAIHLGITMSPLPVKCIY